MDPAHRLAAGVSWIDLLFLGRPTRIAAALLHGAEGAAIVDPGPTSCLPTLERALEQAGAPLRRGVASAAHAHPPGSCRSRRHDRAAPSRASASWSTEHGAPHLVDPPSCSRARRGSTAPTWTACGAPSSPCRSGSCRSWTAARRWTSPAARSSVTYTPGHAQAPRQLLRPDERPCLGRTTWPASVSDGEVTCCRRRRRRTSTWRRGAPASSVWSDAGRTRCS